MSIPITFYVRFWLTNSMMAMATGFVIGYMLMGVIPIIMPPLTVPVLAFMIYQIAIHRYFWGNGRGNFEYAYRERLVEKKANALVLDVLGLRKFIRLYLDELSAMGMVREEIYEEVLSDKGISKNDDLKFYIYLKVAKSSLKDSSFERELNYLRKAVSIRSNDLVANYRLANSLERVASGQAAVQAYESALRDPAINTTELKEFILDQIKRVETEGPAKKPPMPGLRFMTW
jgi:hypothetical protein